MNCKKRRLPVLLTYILGLVLFFASCGGELPSVFTVRFDANGGGGGVPDWGVKDGESIPLPSGAALSRSGFTFMGWSTNSSGGTILQPGTNFTVRNNTTLFARWGHTVTFAPNNASGWAPQQQLVEAWTSISLPGQESLSMDGATFQGWSTTQRGGTILTAGSSFTVNSNVTLYARWGATVTFLANGGSGSPPAAQTVSVGDSITLPGQGALTLAGSTFLGWSTSQTGGVILPVGTSFTVNRNTNLYARWQLIPPSL